jgi:C-methyltransferase-like protein
LLYYTLATLSTLLDRHGLQLFDATLLPIHGGSIVAYAARSPGPARSDALEALLAAEERAGSNTLEHYRRFAARIEELKRHELSILAARKAEGKRIYGFGAPVKGNTLLNHFGIGTETLDCLVERNELRRGLYSPGRHIPIRIESELTEPPDVYYVLAWNFRDEILRRNQGLLARGVEFVFPIQPV